MAASSVEQTLDNTLFRGKIHVIFLDLETRFNLLTEQNNAIGKEILQKSNDELIPHIFIVVTRRKLSRKEKRGCCQHLQELGCMIFVDLETKTEATETRKENAEIKQEIIESLTTKTKNAADFRIIRLLVEKNLGLDEDVAFTIVSADRSFDAIAPEISGRSVVVASTQKRHDFSKLDMFQDIFRIHRAHPSEPTQLDKTTIKLLRVFGLSKIVFVTSDMIDRQPKSLKSHLANDNTKMLLFVSTEMKQKLQTTDTRFDELSKHKNCFLITTSSDKDDAPVFLLVLYALSLHHSLVGGFRSSAFCILSGAADSMPFDDIQEGCKGREVSINYFNIESISTSKGREVSINDFNIESISTSKGREVPINDFNIESISTSKGREVSINDFNIESISAGATDEMEHRRQWNASHKDTQPQHQPQSRTDTNNKTDSRASDSGSTKEGHKYTNTDSQEQQHTNTTNTRETTTQQRRKPESDTQNNLNKTPSPKKRSLGKRRQKPGAASLISVYQTLAFIVFAVLCLYVSILFL